ncbi:uncharacterized protein LOC144094557 [Amblyomma americanum]
MVKASLFFLVLLLLLTIMAGLIAGLMQEKVEDGDDEAKSDGDVKITEPTQKTTASKRPPPLSAPSTSSTEPTVDTSQNLVFCTVSETLLVEDPITEGLCDYAVFSDLEASDEGGFDPADGHSAWEIFKRGVSAANRTVGGVSFSPLNSEQPGSTMRRLEAMGTEVNALADLRMLAMGTLNLRAQQWRTTDSFANVFRQLKSVLKSKQGAVTFLGVWLQTVSNAKSFVKAITKTNDIDLLIVQTHIAPFEGMSDPCVAYLVSQKKADGVVPNYDVADAVLRELRQRPSPSGAVAAAPRVLLSSTLAAVAYVGAPNGADVTLRQRFCDLFFVADIDVTCEGTAGELSASYVKADMAHYATFRHRSTGYFVTFEEIDSLQDKITSYKGKLQGWAFFDVHRDVYWPCKQSRPYRRLEWAVSLLKPSRTARARNEHHA